MTLIGGQPLSANPESAAAGENTGVVVLQGPPAGNDDGNKSEISDEEGAVQYGRKTPNFTPNHA